MTDIENIPRHIIVFYYLVRIKDKAVKKAFIEVVPQLATNKDIAELAGGLINGTITLD